MTAIHLLGPTFSLNMKKESVVAIIGEMKARVNASAKEITDIA